MILWIDLETTGLEPKECSILEVGMVLTDDNLKPVDNYSTLVQPLFGTLEKMDSYVRNMHTKNGLLAELADPKRDIPRRFEAETKLIDMVYYWLKPNFKKVVEVVLAGSSVHFDRSFLEEHMPEFAKLFGHRLLDVSVFTEVAKRWMPNVYATRPKAGQDAEHRALADVMHSIACLHHYRAYGFIHTSVEV